MLSFGDTDFLTVKLNLTANSIPFCSIFFKIYLKNLHNLPASTANPIPIATNQQLDCDRPTQI